MMKSGMGGLHWKVLDRVPSSMMSSVCYGWIPIVIKQQPLSKVYYLKSHGIYLSEFQQDTLHWEQR